MVRQMLFAIGVFDSRIKKGNTFIQASLVTAAASSSVGLCRGTPPKPILETINSVFPSLTLSIEPIDKNSLLVELNIKNRVFCQRKTTTDDNQFKSRIVAQSA